MIPDNARRYQQRSASLVGLVIFALLAVLLALGVGSVPLTPSVVWTALTTGGAGLADEVVLQLRLPRALSAFATGGLLALSGALLQVLLRNPLAEPYLLGVSGGAAVGALLIVSVGLGGVWLHGAACCGALVSTLLVFGLSRGLEPARLLLIGVVVAAGWGAVVSFLLALSPDAGLRGMLFWLMGDLGQAQFPGMTLLVLALGLVVAMFLAPRLNILLHGELTAAALGIAVEGVRITVYILSSLLTAMAVTEAGCIGFVGLIVPHLVRQIAGSDHRFLLPAATLLGGILLLLADTLARTIAAPRELPVGVMTAFLGVPVFLLLLRLPSSRRLV